MRFLSTAFQAKLCQGPIDIIHNLGWMRTWSMRAKCSWAGCWRLWTWKPSAPPPLGTASRNKTWKEKLVALIGFLFCLQNYTSMGLEYRYGSPEDFLRKGKKPRGAGDSIIFPLPVLIGLIRPSLIVIATFVCIACSLVNIRIMPE